MDEAAQAVTFHILGEAKLGPKLLGVDKGLRIEEYIDGHTLTIAESRNPNVIKALARNLARLHSLQVPTQQLPCFAEHMRQAMIDMDCVARNSDIIRNIATVMPHIAEKIKTILTLGHVQNFHWLLDEVIPRIKHRRVYLSHGDHYMNNVLLKNSVTDINNITEFDIVVVDVELCSYYCRGLDIGFMLYEMQNDYSDTSKPKNVGPIDEKLERLFIEEYLDRWIELNPDKYDPVIDNFDNVLKEAHSMGFFAGHFFPVCLLRDFTLDPNSFNLAMFDYIIERHEVDEAHRQHLKQMLGL